MTIEIEFATRLRKYRTIIMFIPEMRYQATLTQQTSLVFHRYVLVHVPVLTSLCYKTAFI